MLSANNECIITSDFALRIPRIGVVPPEKTCEAPRPQGGASRKRNTVLVVPLDPAYKAGLAGHLPVNKTRPQQAAHYHLPIPFSLSSVISYRAKFFLQPF
jgi:hypothetical protein